MKKILKEIAIRLLPAALGFVAYLIYAPVWGHDPLKYAVWHCLGPIIFFLQNEPVLGCILYTLVSLALISAHIIWRKWYTAPISFFGGFAWCYSGMGAAGISCWGMTPPAVIQCQGATIGELKSGTYLPKKQKVRLAREKTHPTGLISIVFRIEWRLGDCEGCVE